MKKTVKILFNFFLLCIFHFSIFARDALPPLINTGESFTHEEDYYIPRQSAIYSVAMSQDGKIIVSGSRDKSIKIWDVKTGKLLKTLKGHSDSITSVTTNQNANIIVSGSNDSNIKIWDMKTGELLKTLKGNRYEITSVAVSQDGNTVVSSSRDKSIKIWDVKTGKLLKIIKRYGDFLNSVSFSRDGHTIVSGSIDTSVSIWDVKTGELLKNFKGISSRVNSVAMSQDGKMIVAGLNDKSIKIWNVKTGKLLKSFNGHTGIVNSVAISQDGRMIVSASWDKSIKIWDVKTGKLLKSLKGHTDNVTSVAISHDGHTIISGSHDKSIKIWDVKTGELLKSLKGHRYKVTSIAISQNGHTMVSDSGDNSIKIWDIKTGKLLKSLKSSTYWISSVVISQDGSTIVSNAGDRSVKIWDVRTSKLLKSLKGHTNWLSSVAMSQDNRTIVSSSEDNSMKIWDIKTGKLLKSLNGHTDNINSIAISHDGNTIISGSRDKSIKIWDAKSGALLKNLAGHTKEVTSVAISQDGHTIISGSKDKSIKIWNIKTGTLLKSLEGQPSSVIFVAISQNDESIVIGLEDGSIKLWSIKKKAWQKEFIGGRHGCWVVFVYDGSKKYFYRGDDGTFLMKKNGTILTPIYPKDRAKKDYLLFNKIKKIKSINNQPIEINLTITNQNKIRPSYWITANTKDKYCAIGENNLMKIDQGEKKVLSMKLSCALPRINPKPIPYHEMNITINTATGDTFHIKAPLSIDYINLEIKKAEISEDRKNLNVLLYNAGDEKLKRATVHLFSPFQADIQNLTNLEAHTSKTLAFALPLYKKITENLSLHITIPNEKYPNALPLSEWYIKGIKIDLSRMGWYIYIVWALGILGTLFVIYQYRRYGNSLVRQLSKNPQDMFTLTPHLLKVAKKRLSRINRFKTILEILEINQEQFDKCLAFFEMNEEEKVAFLAERLDASYTKEEGLYRISLPEDFNLNAIKSFLLYVSDEIPNITIKKALAVKHKVFVLTKNQHQNSIMREAHDRTNFLIAPRLEQLSKLLLSQDAKEVLIEIFTDCLLAKEISPYQVNGDIKNESNFFGRIEILRDILGNEENYLIVSSRQLGKSSILRALQRRYDLNPNINSYLFTMHDEKILLEIKNALGLANELSLEKIVQYLSKQDKKSVFLVDEVDEFLEADAKNDYKITKSFRKLAQDGKATFVMVGFWTLYYYATHDYHAPLKNFGELIKLGGLEDEACRELMLEPMKRIGVRYENNQIIEDLMVRCGNRANLIAITCHEVLKVIENDVITQENIEEVIRYSSLEDYLKGWQTISKDEEENTLDRAILFLTLKKQSFRLRNVIKILVDLGLTSIDENKVNQSLERLVVGYFLKKDRGEYSYCVPLFKEKLLYEDIEILLERELRRLKKYENNKISNIFYKI